MGRPERIDGGGMVYHVINRANFRSTLFSKEKEYQQFIDILKEAKELHFLIALSWLICYTRG